MKDFILLVVLLMIVGMCVSTIIFSAYMAGQPCELESDLLTLEHKILTLEQQMYTRTQAIKKLGLKHNCDVSFIFERYCEDWEEK